MTIQLGILLALLCALTTNLGFLLKHRGACAAPGGRLPPARSQRRRPVPLASGSRSACWWPWAPGSSTWAPWRWRPLSLVQAVISGGLVFLTVLADRFFGCEVGARQWIGVGLTAVGLSLLAVTLPHSGDAHSGYSVGGMIAFEAGLLTVGCLLVLSPQFGASHEHHGVLMGAAAGILFGVSDVAIKALTGSVGGAGLLGLASPWLLTCVARLGHRLLRLRARASSRARRCP